MNMTECNPASGTPWRIEGDLTVYTVETLRPQMLEHLGQPGTLILDLGAVNACDCIGLQLLCAVRKSAHTLGKMVQATRFSPAILKSAEDIGLMATELPELMQAE